MLRLNSNGEYLFASSGFTDMSGDYTCTFWARVPTTSMSNYVSLFYIDNGGSYYIDIFTAILDSYKFTLEVSDGVSFLDTVGFTYSSNLLPFGYVKSGTAHRFYCKGTLIGTVILDFSGAGSASSLNLGYDGGGASIGNADIFDFREWTEALTLDELLSEWKSTTAVKTSNLNRECPLLSDADDVSGNGYDLSANGSVSYIGSPEGRNLVSSTATELAIPSSGTYNANNNDNTETFTLWFSLDIPSAVKMMSAYVYNAGSYHPIVKPYDNSVAQILNIEGDRCPIQFPVVENETFYLFIDKNTGNFNPASFSLAVQAFSQSTVPVGSIAVNDDTPGFPLAILSATEDQKVLDFILGYPAGEAGDTLTSAIVLVEDFSDNTLKVMNPDNSQLASLPFTGTPIIRTCRGANKFYVGSNTNPPIVTTVNEDGSFGSTSWTLTGNTGLKGLAANNDETILYFTKGGFNAPIKRWDLVNDVALSDLAPGIANRSPYDILFLSDESIIVFYSGADCFINRYSTTGVILNTLSIGAAALTAPRLAYSLRDDGSFWAWYQPDASGIESNFFEIRASDLTIIRTRIDTIFETGSYAIGATASPISLFGNSFSCPFWVVQGEIPVTPGILILTPGRRRDLDVQIPTPFFETYFTGG